MMRDPNSLARKGGDLSIFWKATTVTALIGLSACAAATTATPLRVTGAAAPYGYADGAAAKRAAMAICAGQGRRLNPNSFGHFDAGVWEFKEGCV